VLAASCSLYPFPGVAWPHLLKLLWLWRNSTSMPQSGRRPQHQKRTRRDHGAMSALPLIVAKLFAAPRKSHYRIRLSAALNQCCVPVVFLESMNQCCSIWSRK
jgi:hypothetical protein